MKLAQLNAFGIPSQVVDCIEGEEPGAPGWPIAASPMPRKAGIRS